MNNNINEKDLKGLNIVFNKMYYCISSSIFYRGGTRGHAEQKALEYMNTFVEIKTSREHPMNEALQQINSEHRKAMSEYIMKDSSSDDIFNGNDIVKKGQIENADKEYRAAVRDFGNFYKQYQPEQLNNIQSIVNMQQSLQKIQRLKSLGK